MEHWDAMKTAYVVARLGTVSAAAKALGVHRATVVRHVDTVESELGGPLFHRHRQGYELTEAGEDLLATASVIDDQLDQLARRTRGRTLELEGELTITALAMFTPLVLDLVEACSREHPGLRLRFEVGSRVLSLDRGEAHVALRVGQRPTQPEEVVQSARQMRSSLYAHPSYLERRGTPSSEQALRHHAFVVDRNALPDRWLREWVPDADVVFSSPDTSAVFDAIARGVGLGLCPDFMASRLGLVRVFAGPPRGIDVWVVTHHRMHRSARVRWVSRRLREQLLDEFGEARLEA
ncbi:MAG: LysR family transcriptional regulator [Myxococcales bacterium]|nr:LysR family transcriptional regulator [Myxococcales bacterium]